MYAERQIDSLPPVFQPMGTPLTEVMLDAESLQGAVDSTDLLRGRKTVTILHNGTAYRLQSTKLGKLILTK